MKTSSWILAAVVAAFGTTAQAACPTDNDITAMMTRYSALEPISNPPPDLTDEDAACGRSKFAAVLKQKFGKPVGYKAALTNPAVQKALNYPNPVWGTMFEPMLTDGAEVPAKFGARPLFEADLIVEVKDAAINQAKTHLEALRHISNIYPFIELPDIMVETSAKLTGPAFVYINAGARFGVLGKPLPVAATPELIDALANMTVRMSDLDGKELESGKGATLLGHPLNAVLWLIDNLNRSGIALQQGDLLSLGSFSRPQPPRQGTGITVTYDGLPGKPTVSVRFK